MLVYKIWCHYAPRKKSINFYKISIIQCIVLHNNLLVFLFSSSLLFSPLLSSPLSSIFPLDHHELCPVLSLIPGACVAYCTINRDCPENTTCCPHGCGYACAKTIIVPYQTPPLICPVESGILCLECNNECSEAGEICCATKDCVYSCTKAVIPSPLCSYMREKASVSSKAEEYVPECKEDGSFLEQQCYGSTGQCWCADSSSGKPTSELFRFREKNCSESMREYLQNCCKCFSLLTIACSYGGKMYTLGQTFHSLKTGSCNLW